MQYQITKEGKKTVSENDYDNIYTIVRFQVKYKLNLIIIRFIISSEVLTHNFVQYLSQLD